MKDYFRGLSLRQLLWETKSALEGSEAGDAIEVVIEKLEEEGVL